MIPRTKVNYCFADLARAFVIGERKHQHRERLLAMIRRFTGFELVLLTPSGRGGLCSILRALPQTRVLVPAYTCKAVVEAALIAGKTVVHADVEEDGFNMTASSLLPFLNSDSIVIATHQFGIPCDITAIADLCRQHGAPLIEDVAAALGSRVAGRLVGSFGDAAFYSFDSTKLITVPLKAGFVTVRDPALFAQIAASHRAQTELMPLLAKFRLLVLGAVLLALQNPMLYRCFHQVMFAWRRRCTQDSAVLDTTIGAFYRYDFAEWQAAIACPQFARIDDLIRKRQDLYQLFSRELAGCNRFELPPPDLRRDWACIRFPLRIRGDKIAFYRQASRQGVDFAFSFTFIVAPPSCPRAHALAAAVLDPPYFDRLSIAEAQYVVKILIALENSRE